MIVLLANFRLATVFRGATVLLATVIPATVLLAAGLPATGLLVMHLLAICRLCEYDQPWAP